MNRDGAEQVGEVLARQGVDLLVVELTGYDIHLDVSFLMIDRDLAILNPMGLPFSLSGGVDAPRHPLDRDGPGG